MSDSTSSGFEIRFFGIMSIIVACVVLLYGATFRGDPEVSMILLTASVMLSIGLTFGVLMTGAKFKFWDMRIFESILWGGSCFAMMLVIRRLVPLSFTVTAPINPRYLGVLIGVAEECFFRIFLCGVGSKFSMWGGIIGSSVIWSAYHIFRYGGDFNVLLLIFLVGCSMGWIYLNTKFADGVIFGHAFVNYITF